MYRRNPLYVRETLFTALCAFDAARHNKSKRFESLGRQTTATIKRWVKNGNCNCRHWLLMLQAEQDAMAKNPKTNTVLGKFENAAAEAAAGGFLHDKALIHERTSMFLKRQKEADRANSHLQQAFDLYVAWGALTKARQLEAAHPCLDAKSLPDDSTSGSDSLTVATRSSGGVSASRKFPMLKSMSFDE